MGFRLLISGPRACFPRPGFYADIVSYDVIPPLHAENIFSSIYWRPGMIWTIRRFHVLSCIRFDIIDHGSARTAALAEVQYVLDARFEITDGNEAQHTKAFRRAAIRQRPYSPPFLGHERFPASFKFLEKGDPMPASYYADADETDLGWLPVGHDQKTHGPRYFRAKMVGGIIEVPEGAYATQEMLHSGPAAIFR